MIPTFGNPVKLFIMPFKDAAYQDPAGPPFTTSINPETYTYKYKTEYCETQGAGSSGTTLKYTKTAPQEFNFDFLFDGTGVIKDGPSALSVAPGAVSQAVGVTAQIEVFKSIVFDYQGEKHRPNYLVIMWGTLIFKGVLTNMDIEYKLFNPEGLPLRAVAKCAFKGSIEDVLRIAQDNPMSPDITHQRTFSSGDTLPLMSNTIYGDQQYYIDVANANKLDGFRNIKTGTSIYFIPIEK